VSTDERGGGPADHADEPVGSVAEEAAKLFGALGEALADRRGGDLRDGAAGLAGHAARSFRDLDEHLATGAPECTYCPLCRAVHAVRQTSPEVRAHLVAAASSLVQAASGWLATVVPDHAADRPGGVEHIDLDDPDDRDDPDDPDDLDDVDDVDDPEEDGR
jgi:hypothetical protein